MAEMRPMVFKIGDRVPGVVAGEELVWTGTQWVPFHEGATPADTCVLGGCRASLFRINEGGRLECPRCGTTHGLAADAGSPGVQEPTVAEVIAWCRLPYHERGWGPVAADIERAMLTMRHRGAPPILTGQDDED